ncbi:hypothetical protein BKI52_43525 [marine bacterium AO1-C]|nr:hypothetical protein BKI52_43525 [marine bacterium AO1-C]
MWKSKFDNLALTPQNTLSKNQMRHIKGGGSATADCGGGKSVSCSGVSCDAKDGTGCRCRKAGSTNEFDTKSCTGKKPVASITPA